MIPSAKEIKEFKNIDFFTLEENLEELTEREKCVLKHRLIDKLTLTAIGLKYNVTRERVRQIEHKGLKRLRQNLIKKSHKLDQEESCGTKVK